MKPNPNAKEKFENLTRDLISQEIENGRNDPNIIKILEQEPQKKKEIQDNLTIQLVKTFEKQQKLQRQIIKPVVRKGMNTKGSKPLPSKQKKRQTNELLDKNQYSDQIQPVPAIDDKETIEMLTNQKILLQELHNDKKDIPIKCSQSLLYEILINGILLKYPILIPEYEKLINGKHVPQAKQKLIENLNELRDKISEEKRLSPDIKTILNNINKNDLFDNLISLKKELLGIDVRDLQRLIQKTKQAEYDIRGKSIVLFIGDTGSGKTTTILGLYGFTMVKKKFKGMDWVTPLQTIRDEKLKLLHTSPQQKSITRYPLAILPKQRISNTQQVWFLDTPGFGDSAGVEVDLANGIGTINTIKSCKSVRSVVVISKQSWGTRGAGIKKLAKLLGNLFGNYKNVRDNVMFIWNRFNQDDLKELYIKINDIIQNLTPQQKVNQNLKSLLGDLAFKSKRNLIHYNPLIKDSHIDILEQIQRLTELESPDQYFNLSLTQTTNNKLKQQCYLYQNIIYYHFDNNNVEFVKYFLKNYNLLQSIVRIPYIREQYEKVVNNLEKTIRSRFQNESQNLCRRMRSFNLSVDDISNFQKQKQEIERYKILDSFMTDIPNRNKYMQILQEQIQFLVNILKEQDCAEMKKLLETLKLIKNKYDIKLLKQIEPILQKKLHKLKEDYTQAIYESSEDSFTKAANMFKKYNQILKMLSQYKEDKNQPKNQLVNILPEYIKNEISKLNLNQLPIRITQINCKKWNALQQKLDKIKANYQIMILHNEIVQFEKSIDGFKMQLSIVVNNSSDSINKIIQDLKQGANNEYSVDNLYNKIFEFDLLKLISSVKQTVQMKIDQRTEKMQIYLNIQRSILNQIQQSIEQKSSKNNLKKLLGNLEKALDGIQRLSRFSSQDIQNSGNKIIKTVMESLVSYLEKNQNELDTISINFRASDQIIHDQLNKITKIMSEIQTFAKASKRLPENTIKQIQQSGSEIIKKVIEQLDNQIQELIKKSSIQENPYSNVNLNLTDKGVYFLNIARSQLGEFMKKQISEIRLKYEQELQKFKKYIYDEVSEESIKKLKTVNQTDVFQNKVRKIKKKIDVLSQIMNRHQNIKQFVFLDIEIQLNTIKESVEQFYEQQNKKWEKTIKKSVILNDKIILNQRCRILSIFDKISNEVKFSQLFSDIGSYIQSMTRDVHINIKNCLEANNFTVINRQLRTLYLNKGTLEGQVAFNQALFQIEATVNKVANQINNNLKRSRIQTIDITFDFDYFQQLQKLSIIKTNISQFISEQSNIIYIIDGTTKNLQEIIKSSFENCAIKVQQLIIDSNFQEAQEKCKELKRYEQIIRLSLSPIKRQFKFAAQKQERHEKWKRQDKLNKIHIKKSKLIISEELQIQISERLEDFKQKYLNLKDNQNIDNKFKILYNKVFRPNQNFFSNLKSRIDDKIKQRLEHKLEMIWNQKNLKDEHRLINQFNLELQKIPKEIHEGFNIKLQTCKSEKSKKRIQQQSLVSQLFNDKDHLNTMQIYVKFDEANKNNHQALKKKIKDHVGTIIQQTLNNIKNQNNQVKQIYQIFKDKISPYYQYNQKNYFQELVKKNCKYFIQIIKNKLQSYGKQIKQISKLNKDHEESDNDYQIDMITVTSKRISQQILKYFEKLIEIFVYIKNNKKEVKLLEECFLTQFKNKVITYSRKYLQSMQYIKDKFNALERQIKIVQEYTNYFIILNKISDAIMKVSCQIQIIQDLHQYELQPELINIKNEIEKVGKFRDVKEKFILKFQEIYQELLNFSFERDDIVNADDAIRNDQFLQISNKLVFIKNYENIYLTIKNGQVKGKNNYDQCQQIIKGKILKISKENTQVIQLIAQNERIDEAKLQKFNINIKILKLCESKFPDLISADKNFQKYQNIKKRLHQIIRQYSTQGQNYINILVNQFEKNKTELIKLANIKSKQIKQAEAKIQLQFKKILDEKTKQFQQRIENENDEKEIQDLENQRDSEITTIKTQKRDKIKEIQDKIRTQQEKQKEIIQTRVNQLRISLAQLLIELKMFSTNILEFQKEFNQEIKYILDKYEKKCGKKYFRPLALAIDSLKNMYGARILSEQQKFRGYKLEKFKRNMENVGIKQVIQQLELNLQQKQKLNRKYQQYKQKYDQSLKFYSSNPIQSTIQNLKQNIKTHSSLINENLKKQKFHSGHQLIAQIFALWTILKADVTEQGVFYLYQPHPAQIVAIFCILGMSENGSLGNRFAEVLTGQGKSIILAGLVTYLTCVGYQVNCVCYSKYLSDRDQKLFKELFENLSINDYIKYGTFNEICQDLFNSELKLRKNVQKILFQSQHNKLVNIFNDMANKIALVGKSIKNVFNLGSSREKILVIDEVDVFFSQDFYGNLYLPYIGINKPIIRRLIGFIWKNRQNPQLYSQALDSEQYIQSISQFPSLKDLIFEAVKGMIRSVRNWNHQYIVLNNKIAYKQQDGISFKTNYGYNTIFAYFYECQKGNISIQSRQEAIEIGLTIGEFSYSMLPKYFKHIMGVTGTLKILSDVKKKICVEEYNIKEHFYIPSVYGRSRREYKGIKIVPDIKHRQQIVNEAKSILDQGRSVLIFVQTIRQANQFNISNQFQLLRSKCVVLNQQHDDDTKTGRINRASIPGNITIMTKSFGRGTDFVIYSEQLRNRGGLHVIQTFLSEQQSEQVQIMGRVARQGDLGSYSLIINVNDLEKINLKAEINDGKVEIKQIDNQDNFEAIKQIINKKRNETYKQKYEVSISNAKQYEKNHQRSMNMINNLLQRKYKEVIEYIKSLNSFPEVFKAKPVKTILALDATGSMSNVLAKTASIIESAFKNAQKVIKNKKPEATFELQIAIYRNYNCRAQELFSYTPFECKPEKISRFLKEVKATGGWGNQALEILYNHVNKQPNLDQVIIIGDAPTNSFSETKQKRNKIFGQNYWKNTQYNQPLNAELELNKIIQKKIKIHTFYIGNNPKRYFQRISDQTKGQSKQFKPTQKNPEIELEEFITTKILDKIGGKLLVEEYQATIVKARHK